MTKVFVTGIFDLLHVEHVRFLTAARQHGDKLVVGIESDIRVKKLKGTARPVMSQADRKQMLEALAVVDEVVILPERFDSDDDYRNILKEVGADVYAVSEKSPFLENKRRLCREAGITCAVVHRYNPEYSTTKLIEKICTP